jgi:hypothetical protein
MLWAIAITFVPIDAVCAGNRTLTFTSDLLTLTAVAASVATVLWYLDHNLVSHLVNWRIGIEYGFKHGLHIGRGDRRACDHGNSSGEHLAELYTLDPLRNPNGHQAFPEMRRTGDHMN